MDDLTKEDLDLIIKSLEREEDRCHDMPQDSGIRERLERVQALWRRFFDQRRKLGP
jgi:hypothetical protein